MYKKEIIPHSESSMEMLEILGIRIVNSLPATKHKVYLLMREKEGWRESWGHAIKFFELYIVSHKKK